MQFDVINHWIDDLSCITGKYDVQKQIILLRRL